MKKRILAILMCFVLGVPMVCNAKGITPGEENEVSKIKTTAYCVGTTTASGTPVRYGVCAADDEHFGKNWVAMIWTEDGSEFLGYFECEDKGGTEAIHKGYVIDVYCPTYDECVEWMKKTNGKCLVKFVWAEG